MFIYFCLVTTLFNLEEYQSFMNTADGNVRMHLKEEIVLPNFVLITLQCNVIFHQRSEHWFTWISQNIITPHSSGTIVFPPSLHVPIFSCLASYTSMQSWKLNSELRSVNQQGDIVFVLWVQCLVNLFSNWTIYSFSFYTHGVIDELLAGIFIDPHGIWVLFPLK